MGEEKLDNAESITSELHTLAGDISEKKTRIENLKNDLKALQYESKSAEKNAKRVKLDERREELNQEIRSLSLQADSRARLDLKRSSLKTDSAKVKNTYVLVDMLLTQPCLYTYTDLTLLATSFASLWGQIPNLRQWVTSWIT